MAEIPFRRDFKFEYAVAETLSPLIRRVVARNPSPFTAKGTGTYIVGHGKVAIVDPGPDIAEHVDALLHALRGETIEHLLITHTHIDHSPATAAVKKATGARSYGFGPHGAGRADLPSGLEAGGDRGFVPDQVLRDGDTVEGAGWRMTAVHTPGHTSNHLCYALAEEKVLFTGDHVMGWSTSVIAPPDGSLGDYMRSLDKLLKRDDALYWPTHGPSIPDPKPFVQAFVEHRNARTEAILKRLAAGDSEIPAIVSAVYVGLPANLHKAAGHSVLAHMIELIATGRAESDGPPAVTARYRLKR
jgi:glyoxylase-like metal-dependent hydrolase (beta-lactamase superfamily II)